MSKVKIQGHASGTGVLTVTAPNTSTDRTITLPDGTGTLLTTDGDGSSLTGTADATKLPLAGGTMTGNISHGDDVKGLYGTGSDLEIYHDGSDSYLKDNGIGNLILKTNGTKINLYDGAQSNTMADFSTNGSCDLYYAGSKKIETTNTGVSVTGTLAATTVTGDGSGLTNLPAAGETAAAWCNVSGNSSIGDSYNVSSITDITTGKHYVNIDTDFSSTNYAIGSCGENNDSFISHIPSKATDKFEVWTTNAGNNSRYDTNSSSIVFGD